MVSLQSLRHRRALTSYHGVSKQSKLHDKSLLINHDNHSRPLVYVEARLVVWLYIQGKVGQCLESIFLLDQLISQLTRKSFRYRSFSQATRDGIKKKNGVKRREKSAAAQLYVTICLRENQRSTDTYTQVLYVHMYTSAACIHTHTTPLGLVRFP